MINSLQSSEEVIIDSIETLPQYKNRVKELKDKVQEVADMQRKTDLQLVIKELVGKGLKIRSDLVEQYNNLIDYYIKF